jgi:hypothetical protein
MAQGDVVFFDQWLVDVAEAKHDHELGTFYMGLVTNATPPTVDIADPRWGAGGTTNFKSTECTPGGNYAADGAILSNPSVVLNGTTDLAEIDFDDPATWSQNASNPTNATWGIIYNNQAAKECVGYVDLGGAFDMTTGDLTVTFGAPAATLNQA